MYSFLKHSIKLLYAKLQYRLYPLSGSAPFILMYHRVINPTDLDYVELPGMYVDVKRFEMHVSILKKNFTILPLRQLLNFFFEGKNLNNHCAITFDDGWRDNYSNAYTILNQHGIPASVFLSTSFIDTNKLFWPEEVCRFLTDTVKTVEIDREIFNSDERSFLGEFLAKEKITGEILTECVDRLKNFSQIDRSNIINKIISSNMLINNRSREILSWDEIGDMKNSGLIDFYPHGHNHLFLSELSVDQMKSEIESSIKIIQSKIPTQETNIYCYASGRCSKDSIAILEKNDIAFALDRTGGALTENTNKYKLPRIPIHGGNSANESLFGYLLLRNTKKQV